MNLHAAGFRVLLLGLIATCTPAFSQARVVISQVYGGGGNSGATYKNDFIELFNSGDAEQDLNSWSVQYAGSAGNTWQTTPLSGSIQPGHYFLVEEAAGAGGAIDLPTRDAVGTIPMAAVAGKVALVSSSTPLSVACPSEVADLIGYGAGTCFEGSAPAPAPSNTTAVIRAGLGCTDGDSNSTDFSTAAPNPHNSASPVTA